MQQTINYNVGGPTIVHVSSPPHYSDVVGLSKESGKVFDDKLNDFFYW